MVRHHAWARSTRRPLACVAWSMMSCPKALAPKAILAAPRMPVPMCNMSMTVTGTTGILPVPRETTTSRGCIFSSWPVALRASLYSQISVMASRVGLLEMSPPSRNRPNGRK
uniref:Putative secreted protein n=1 Tax=Ixodes ricinus TaxID=34613 RepID=A0A147BFX1_IXORI